MIINSFIYDDAKTSLSKNFKDSVFNKQNNMLLESHVGKAIIKKENKKMVYTYYDNKSKSPIKKKRRSSLYLQENNNIRKH